MVQCGYKVSENTHDTEKSMGRVNIDMSVYPRKEHFEHFLAMENPFVSLTVQVDVTVWLRRLKAAGYPFFLCFQYAAVQAANSVPEFRQRIADGGIVMYDRCSPSWTVALPDGTYRYCTANADQTLEDYLTEAKAKQEAALKDEHLTEEGDVLSQIFVSCVPWISYSGVTMPFPNREFSIPSLLWGKYHTENYPVIIDGRLAEKENTTIPVTVLANHALVDGIHISAFFRNLSRELDRMEFPALTPQRT